jgi:urease accessory protein
MNARLHIETVTQGGISYLKQNYYTPPFKAVNITEDKKGGVLHVMLMSSSPGILDGDDYHLKIEIAGNSHLQLHTQSYQRLFNMKKGASQNMEVVVQKNASFVFIPHPVVPHEHSIFTARNTIHLTDGSHLVWGEILTCGRKLNGEQFIFSKYHTVTDIFLNERLVIKENWLVQPSRFNVHTIGQWEGFSHHASLIIVDHQEVLSMGKEAIYDYLLEQRDITFGMSTFSAGGLIVRLLGYKAEQLFNILNTIATLISSCKPVNNKISAHVN